jgi:hypothetical protein
MRRFEMKVADFASEQTVLRLRSTFSERGTLDGVVYLVLCFVGRDFFLYVGETEDPLDEYLKRKVPLLRKKGLVFEAVARTKQELTTEAIKLQECATARELYAAEQGWIELVKSAFPSAILNGNCGGVRLGTWHFEIGDETVEGFLPLAQHPLNTCDYTTQQLQTRLEVYGWDLRRVLGPAKFGKEMCARCRGAKRCKEEIRSRKVGSQQRERRWPDVLKDIRQRIGEQIATSDDLQSAA